MSDLEKNLEEKRISEIDSMSPEEITLVMQKTMTRYYQLTGRKTVSHIPDEELSQAKKEYLKDLRPITVNDFVVLKKATKKSISDFCSMLGITRQKYYDISKNREKSEVIKEVPLCLLIRLFKKLPSLIPENAPKPIKVHEAVGGADKINFQAMAIVFGRGSASSRRWKEGTPPSEVSRPMMAPLLTSNRASDVFDVMIDNAYEEARVRGLRPFYSMGWNGVPEEGTIVDVERSFLNAPTVDHRRTEAKEGKIVGWGATDPGLKHIPKSQEIAEKEED